MREEQKWCESVAKQLNCNSRTHRMFHLDRSDKLHSVSKDIEDEKVVEEKKFAKIAKTPSYANESDSTKFGGAKCTDTVLDHVNVNSRYASDFEELE